MSRDVSGAGDGGDSERWAQEAPRPADQPEIAGSGVAQTLKTFLPSIDQTKPANLYGEINKLRQGYSDTDIIDQFVEAKEAQQVDEGHDGPEYNKTWCARLAKNKCFEYITLSIIGVNSMWIGYDTDQNTASNLYDAEAQFVIAENFFCVYFTVEVLVRLIAFKNKMDIFRLFPFCGYFQGVQVVKVHFPISGINFDILSGNKVQLERVAQSVERVCATEAGLASHQVKAEVVDNGVVVLLGPTQDIADLKQNIASSSGAYTQTVLQVLESMEMSTGPISVEGLAIGFKMTRLGDFWIKFDSLLVLMMIAETWILPFLGDSSPLGNLAVLRLLRLLRITRMARLMRSVPELMTIVKGMFAATRSVIVTLALLVLVTYVFAIVFTGQFHEYQVCGMKYGGMFRSAHAEFCEGIIENGTEEEGESVYIYAFFGTMEKTMMTLFVHGTLLDDLSEVVHTLLAVSTPMLLVFIGFILISSFTMLNMLIGILVEVVQAEAECEKNKAKMGTVQELMDGVFKGMDQDGSGKISLEEFKDMSINPKVVACLKKLDIAPKHLKAYQDILFPSGDEHICFKDFMQHLFRLRPGTAASVLDIEHFRKDLSEQMDKISEHIDKHVANLEMRFGPGKMQRKESVLITRSENCKRYTRQTSFRGGGRRATIGTGQRSTSSLCYARSTPLAAFKEGQGNIADAAVAVSGNGDPPGSALRTSSGSPPPEPPLTANGQRAGAPAAVVVSPGAPGFLENTTCSDIAQELQRRLRLPQLLPTRGAAPSASQGGSADLHGMGCKLQGPPVTSIVVEHFAETMVTPLDYATLGVPGAAS